MRLDESESANDLYSRASLALEALEQAFRNVRKQSLRSELEGAANLVPSLAAAIWHQQSMSFVKYNFFSSPAFCTVWLLRDRADDGSEYSQLLDKFLLLPSSRQTKVSMTCYDTKPFDPQT